MSIQENFFCIFFTVRWYAPAEQPPPKLAAANKIFAHGSSVKWSSKPTKPITQRIKKFKNQRPPAEAASGPFQGPSSYPQLLVIADCRFYLVHSHSSFCRDSGEGGLEDWI